MHNFLYQKGFNLLASKALRDIARPLQDELLELNDHLADKSLLLIGSGGRHLWDQITKDKIQQNIKDHPLDTYTLNVISQINSLFKVEALEVLYPNNPTIYPLGKLIKELFSTHTSPCGPELSKEYGMWFGIRALIVTEKIVELPQIMGEYSTINWTSPCNTCRDTPCLNTVLNNKDLRLSCPYMSDHQYDKEQLDHQSHYLPQPQAIINSLGITEIKL